VLEEKNVTPHVFFATLKQILGEPGVYQEMVTASSAFAKLDAAGKIADEILHVAEFHG
jgi:UDP-N-acetylglucosamine:LPS N-acetylglucosamine transferase